MSAPHMDAPPLVVREEDIVRRLPGDDERDGMTRLWPDRWMSMGQRNPSHPYPARDDIDTAAFRLPALVIDDTARRDFAQWRDEKNLDGPLVLFQPGNEYKQCKAPFRWLVPAPHRRRHLRAAFPSAH